jgi:hypothetical protein
VILRLLLLFMVVAGAVLLVHWFLKEDPKKVARYLRRGALWTAVIAVLLMAATGRLHWLYALVASAVPFLSRLLSWFRYVPILSQIYTLVQNKRAARAGTVGAGGVGRSQVESRFLRMSLDHDSGELDGVVLEGQFIGKRLAELSEEQLIKLYEECHREDAESAALLLAYLDRTHGEEWRSHVGAGASQADRPPSASQMSRQEAYDILDVADDATRDQIIEAHRRLMQKLHPDRGGSTYLAAKINQAKDVLLETD